MPEAIGPIPSAEARRIEFKYDHLGRRIEKLVRSGWNGSVYATVMSQRRFIYNGWNVIAEYSVSGAALTLARTFTWGVDIAHSLAEAGGVGALLQIADHGLNQAFFPAYDGNGNIAALFNGSGASGGTCVAAYEYSPYGEFLRSEGTYAKENPFRFSTKFTDDETGLVYYGRRYYSPSQGRFLGRDPIEEQGGLNLYRFAANNPVSAVDYLGMKPWWIGRAGEKAEITEERDGKVYRQWWTGYLTGNEGADAETDWDLDQEVEDGEAGTGAPPKPAKARCDSLQNRYAAYLRAGSGGYFDSHEDARKAMLINAALGRRQEWEYAAIVIDMRQLTAREGIEYNGPQFFVTPAFSNFMVGKPRTYGGDPTSLPYIEWTSWEWFTRAEGPYVSGPLGGRYSQSAVLDFVHTHPEGGGNSFSGGDDAWNRDHQTGNSMTSWLIGENNRVRNTQASGYNALISQADLRDLKGCFALTREL